jgi:hypothetical protein
MFLKDRILEFLDGDDGGSGGGSGSGSGSGGGTSQQQRKKSPQEAFESLVERDHGGNYESAAWALYNDNFKVRRRAGSAEQERDDLQSRVAPEGAIILTGNDATEYRAYKELNRTPADIKKDLERVGTLETEASERRKDDAVRSAAEKAGYKFKVLNRLGRDLEYVIREETEGEGNDAKKVDRVYVKQGDKEVRLDTYAKTEWEDMLPALVASTQDDAGGEASGVQYFRQGGADTSGSGSGQQKGSLAASATAGFGPPKKKQQADTA